MHEYMTCFVVTCKVAFIAFGYYVCDLGCNSICIIDVFKCKGLAVMPHCQSCYVQVGGSFFQLNINLKKYIMSCLEHLTKVCLAYNRVHK